MHITKAADSRTNLFVLKSLRYKVIPAGDDRVLKLIFKIRMEGFKVESHFVIFDQSRYSETRLNDNLPPTTRDPKSLSMAKEWLVKCGRTHNCQRERRAAPRAENPTRLLYVNRTAEYKLIQLRLCYAKDVTSRIHYLTLSHTWGNQKFLTLTKENHNDFLDKIKFTSLSKTFQDALHVTLALGFKYLWIDSLCILQDDPEDWNTESQRMADIYKNAVCNLCASVPTSSVHGFLRPERALDALPPAVHYDTANPSKTQFISESTPWGLLQDATLYSRAWVLQEQILVG
jgi:hypothetical protein